MYIYVATNENDLRQQSTATDDAFEFQQNPCYRVRVISISWSLVARLAIGMLVRNKI